MDQLAKDGTRPEDRASWDEIRRRNAHRTCEDLVLLLEDKMLRTRLAACRSHELRTGSLQLPCVHWMRHIAYVLEGADGNYPKWARVKVFEVCSTMAAEFREGGAQRFSAALACDPSSSPIRRVLREVARDLLLPENVLVTWGSRSGCGTSSNGSGQGA